MKLRTPVIFAALLLPALVSIHVSATDDSPRFCVVPVKDTGAHRLIGRNPRRIGALPSVVFTTLDSKDSRWTIDADRRLVPYFGPYPVSYLDENPKGGIIFHDHWITEPWSSRIVATSWGNGAVSIIQPGTHLFQRINEKDTSAGYDGPVLLPRQQTTIVTRNGNPYVVGATSLTLWKSSDELAKHGSDGITALFDAPTLAATIMIDRGNAIFAVTDSGESQRIGTLSYGEFGNVFDSPYAKAALFVAQKSVRLIRKVQDGSAISFSSKTLITSSANGADGYYFYSRIFGQVLAYEHGGFMDLITRWRISDLASAWRRLGPDGFELIPGGDNPHAHPSRSHVSWTGKDLNALGVVLLDEAGGYFLYDGKQIVPVVDGERAKIGQYPRVFDLPSIGRVFVWTTFGLKELRNGRLLDSSHIPAPVITISDWPESKRAILFTETGAYVLDSELSVSPVAGSVDIGFDSSVSGATNPATGELVFTGRQNTYLVIDGERSGNQVCHTPH
ncbi:MAG: hypothetical protein KGJ00_13580 [Bradyrhizobium sp.]|nr:hypothetical protein [Bradyrhizobium sp.]